MWRARNIEFFWGANGAGSRSAIRCCSKEPGCALEIYPRWLDLGTGIVKLELESGLSQSLEG